MKRISYFLITLFASVGLGVGGVAMGQDSSRADDVLKQAQAISAATGRPIFAVAGRST
jgi:hypothetical protein